MAYTISKFIIGLTWIFIILNCFTELPEPFATSLYWTGIFFVVAHIIETLIFLPRIKHAGGSAFYHIIMLFVFGACHGLQLPKSAPTTNT